MMQLAMFLLSAASVAASIQDYAKPLITATPTPTSVRDEANELRKRQQDVSYLTQVSWSSFIGQFPWPDPSTGPSCKYRARKIRLQG